VKVKTVYRLSWDFEKEELWLNAMSAKGLALFHYSWGAYQFEQSAPSEWTYRIELLPQLASKPESKNYLAFMADTGAQSVVTYRRWVYFRKLTTDEPFEIFSDRDSRITHYRRALTLYVPLCAALISSMVVETVIGIVNATHGGPGLAFTLPLLAWQLAVTALLATLAIRISRRVRALQAQKQLFE